MDVVTAVLTWRHVPARVGALAACGVAAIVLALPRTWSAGAKFLPQGPASANRQLSGVAAQFGLALGGAAPGQSPEFYRALLTSRALFGALADSRIPTAVGSPRDTLVADLYGEAGDPSPLRREQAIAHLGKVVSTGLDKGGAVEVRIRAETPALAHALAVRLLQLLEKFNIETRQSQARAERVFTEARMHDAGRDLTAAEGDLRRFLEQNRDVGASPRLRFEQDRLERAVNMRQGILTSLTQSFEQARIDEVRNTPVFTLLEAPEVPIRPDARRLALKVVVALVLSVVAALLWVLFGALSRTVSVDGAEAAAFADASAAFRQDLLRPWRLLAPPGSPRR